jgi:hypothetical protein
MGADLVAELDGLVAAHPLRERLWVQFMIALYRSGRQAEALSAYQRARALLADELGLEPSVELADTHRRILAQDPKLLPAVAAVVGAAPGLATAVQERPVSLRDEVAPDRLGSRHSAVPWGEPDLSSAGRPDSWGSEAAYSPGSEAAYSPGSEAAYSPGSEAAYSRGAEAAAPARPAEHRIAAEGEHRATTMRFERVPAEIRPAVTVIAETLTQPCVRALIGELGRGLKALGRGVAALASAVTSRVRAWSGWGAKESLADMK